MFRFLVQNRRQFKLQKITRHQLSLGKNIFRMLVWLCLLIFLHVVAMMIFESMPFADALWLTMTTVTTVGYGDLSPKTGPGQVSTVVLMYLAGITVLAKLAGDYLDYRAERKRKILSGVWRWNMNNHIVIINAPSRGVEQYFKTLIGQLRQDCHFAEVPIQLLTTAFASHLPDPLRKLGVVHTNMLPVEPDAFKVADVTAASHILVMAPDENNIQSDAYTFDILHRLSEHNVRGQIIAECVSDDNRERLKRAGANQVLRPVRAYPEMIVRALTAPGSESVLENLFTFSDDHPVRIDVDIKNICWYQLVSRLIEKDMGTALAYITPDNQVINHPAPNDNVDAKAIIVLGRIENLPSAENVSRTLSQSA